MKALSSLFFCLFLALSLPGCFVQELPSDTIFGCDTNADCGGDGLLCAPRANQRGYCCKPEDEACNGLDDDCDGTVDEVAGEPCYGGPAGTLGVGRCKAGTPTCGSGGSLGCTGEVRPGTEACNGVDDDCDGSTDEDFLLQEDEQNCGQCGRTCSAAQVCTGGVCQTRSETLCDNNADDDSDGATDCADVDCDTLSCGTGCVCRSLTKAEGVCTDGADNDADAKTDCADTDCNTLACGTGCVCRNNVKAEAVCDDTVDNDTDAKTDCGDTDCENQSCGTGCVCRSLSKAESACGDGADNDGDAKTDCEDTDCNNQSCGTGCVCTNARAVETACTDRNNNDGDNTIDCADSDCFYKELSSGVWCREGQARERFCNDTVDNDGDGQTDCADADCTGIAYDATRVCGANNTYLESNCTDGVDNNGDGRTDCQGGRDANCVSGNCGYGCQISNCTVRREIACDDSSDNDFDNNTDCRDSDCNARSCFKTDGTLGTCNSQTRVCQ